MKKQDIKKFHFKFSALLFYNGALTCHTVSPAFHPAGKKKERCTHFQDFYNSNRLVFWIHAISIPNDVHLCYDHQNVTKIIFQYCWPQIDIFHGQGYFGCFGIGSENKLFKMLANEWSSNIYVPRILFFVHFGHQNKYFFFF